RVTSAAAILPCAFFTPITPRLHRLVARTCLCPNVPNPLLRRLAGRRSAGFAFCHVVATRGHVSCPAVSFSRGNFGSSYRREDAAEGEYRLPGWKENHLSGHGNPWSRPLISSSGIRNLLGLGAVDRFVPSGHSEYDRGLDHIDGCGVLDSFVVHSRPSSRG